MPGGGRGGKGNRAEAQNVQDEPADDAGASPGATEGDESYEPTLVDLVGILRAHMGQQEARDARWKEEAMRQDQRFKTLQHQFQMLQLEVQARTSPTPEHTSAGPGSDSAVPVDPLEGPQAAQLAPASPSVGGLTLFQEPRLEKLSENDDIEHFMLTFEKIAAACRWPKTDWVFRLVPLLTGKARSAYVHIGLDELHDYESVKEAILKKYDINPETYRQRFRSTDVEPGETPKELYVRLKELYEKWIRPEGKTARDVGETIILEQFLRMLSPELQVWIKEHDSSTAAEAAKLAELFVAARRKGQPWTYTSWKATKDSHRSNIQHPSKVTSSVSKAQEYLAPALRQSNKLPVCYLCGQVGHTKPKCPKNPAKFMQMCVVPSLGYANARIERPVEVISVKVNGKFLRALIDTGSVQTLVQRELLPPNVICSVDRIPIRCVHGDEKLYPSADVCVEVKGQKYLLKVGVADKLPFPVVLGSDLPVLFELLQSPQMCNLAITRSQAKQTEEPSVTLKALPFYDADLDYQATKCRKSRRQKRQERFRGTVIDSSDKGSPDLPLEYELPLDMGRLQKNDPNLEPLFQAAKANQNVPSSTEEDYVLQNGILYRHHESSRQMVVPKEARDLVLTLGHVIPWAGHLGKHKTLARIKKHFYWPGLRAAVAQFCKTCPQCQITSSRKPSKVPLHPLPIIGVPFERLGMDIVGPVEKSKAGNRYMLVIVDYATRYPEVFPLKSVKAKMVAFSLVQLFARVGFPREILTDQGTNFMSKLLKQVYELLGIKGVRTTPYHPQTDGLTERFNQTLKQMLRKFVNDTGSDWDQWLPYLLFAYREVPQASTGFSPFQLLYGYDVRGPLSLLKETWGGDQERGEPVNAISYVIQMRERLQKMTALAQQHAIQAQQYQKTFYDKSARGRTFISGQKVLVLLPSTESKLLAKWQGPYEVQKQLGPTTYRVARPGEPRSSRVLHVNLLKEWFDRPEEKLDVLLIRAVEEEDSMDDQYLPVPASIEPDLAHLSPIQQEQVKALFKLELFQEFPGRTEMIEHEIVLKEHAQIKRMSYRIPERLLVALKEEVDQMLSLGIIEHSKSEWCNPVVLVPKKDGAIRFCIDFRYLNSVSKFDSYPTPRIDDLLQRLGKAKYLTTIDLCKGYWQVPLAKQSKELTAFRTPWGLFQFTVLPFGLHGAPASFQRLMDQVLNECDYACAYLDDIVIHSQTWEEHLQHLGDVFGRLHSAGLTINPAKCVFAKSETKYLGFVIGNGSVKPQVHKVHALESCPLPQTRKQLRSFLGMAGFYQRFIPNFSARAAALSDMTGSRHPNRIQWTEESKAAFQDIRQSLSKNPVLYSPDFEKPFVLQTDASERGVGAVLLQGPSDDLHPVAFISRKLLPREVHYATVEKEALAVKWALDSLKYYLLGREFVLQTDHKALQWLQRMKDTNGRITRWYLAMQPFRFVVQHIPGRQNVTADYLSRCTSEGSEEGKSVMDSHTYTGTHQGREGVAVCRAIRTTPAFHKELKAMDCTISCWS